ncbi:ankyrin repeat domain-containing protein 1 [Elysia marginata]|uniref:Ankyrin repeat domain-containing protein 1 n=1 Tax=Elysia marginata TaxID=1093978 RepID=A0AAV4FJB2_9GAST|nr:ankyrin repeat domain-containing protein 1 [Elysia marginata]
MSYNNLALRCQPQHLVAKNVPSKHQQGYRYPCFFSLDTSDGVISHVCAVNLRNGSTALHNAVRGGDSAQCLALLLAADRDPLNAQDSVGETVLHTACRLNRRKCVELLLTFPDLDLDIRTLEGSLASEVTTSKAIVKMLEKAKMAAPAKDIDTSLLEVDVQVRPAGSDKSPSMLGSTVNFDKVHSRYEALKYGANPVSRKLAVTRQET